MDKTNAKTTQFWTRGRKRLLFYTLVLVLPVIHFIIFYIYINANSIIMAFQNYVPKESETGYVVKFAGFQNFAAVFTRLKTQPHLFTNAFLHYLIGLVVSMPLSWFLSFYLYKKAPLSGLFKVILFIPSIVSGVVFVLLFQYIVTDVWIILFDTKTGLLGAGQTARLWTTVFYNFWAHLGGHFLLYSGGMSNINESIVESAKLDGANTLQEMFHITLPMIYPTIVTFIVIEISGLFVNQRNLYTFFSENAGNLSTLGYYLYVQTLHSELYFPEADSKWMTYGELTALGFMITAVLMPLTLGIKKLLTKLGPSVN